MRALINTAAAACAAVVVLSALSACSLYTPSTTRPAAGSAARTAPSQSTQLPAGRRAEGPVPLRGQRMQHAEQKSAAVHREPKPKNFCAHNAAAQKVIVSIRKQHAWMCAVHRDVFDTPVTTGMVGQWTHTPRGNFVVQARDTNTVLTLITGQQYTVRYWIPFQGPLFGFHDASWQQFPYGSPKYKTQGSHGCVHMPLKAMKFLYRWSARPTAVHIS